MFDYGNFDAEGKISVKSFYNILIENYGVFVDWWRFGIPLFHFECWSFVG